MVTGRCSVHLPVFFDIITYRRNCVWQDPEAVLMAAVVAVVALVEVLMEVALAVDSPVDFTVARGQVVLDLWEWAVDLCPWAAGTADVGMAVDAVA